MSEVRILNGGALEGADRITRETAMWYPSMRSPDSVINSAKPNADARGRDTVRNNGIIAGAMTFNKDAIVGSQFRLNAEPNFDFLSTISKTYDDVWAAEFQEVVEAQFHLFAESDANWVDAQRMNTFTAIIRMAIGIFFQTGEFLSTAEWIKDPTRPLNTAIQMISPDRLCNPNGTMDTRYLRRGVVRDLRGSPMAYNFRRGEYLDGYADDWAWVWDTVPVAKPWGRLQVLHILDQQLPDQSRGISEMVSTLRDMKMTKTFKEVTLQNAVINASYAAAIESELPPEAVAAAMGQGGGAGGPTGALMGVYATFMNALGSYLGAANNLKVDGAQIPHLFPGTKLNMQPAKTVGGVGTDFEVSLLRHMAAPLGLSYEEFSRDFSKTNYSSARAAMGITERSMNAKKRFVADKAASFVYSLVLEELFARDLVPLPPRQTRDVFYARLAKEAFTKSTWTGSGVGQLDELKETQAAILRISSGISTHRREVARLGGDWRETFRQLAREQTVADKYDLTFNLVAKKPLGQLPTPTDETSGAGGTETIPATTKTKKKPAAKTTTKGASK